MTYDVRRAVDALWTYMEKGWSPSDIRLSYDALHRMFPDAFKSLERQGDHDRLSKLRKIQDHLENGVRRERELQERKAQATAQVRTLPLASWFRERFLEADQEFESILQRGTGASPSPEIRQAYLQEKSAFVREWVVESSKRESRRAPDPEQAAAIATVDRHVLVVARAGSGKTETVASRAAFLQEHCGVGPGEMLLLAFNRKAAVELRERLEQILGHQNLPHVMTFHALAYALVHPEQKLLFNESSGENEGLNRAFQDVLDEHLRAPEFLARVRTVMLSHFRADWEAIIRGGYALTPGEMLRLRRNLVKETLRGEYVKSFGEKVIANFLFEHDIRYEYERVHWWNGLPYRPDFTLPHGSSRDRGIVIEYFGLKGDPDYDAQIEEKRNYWLDKPGWTLLDFSPRDLAEGPEAFGILLSKDLRGAGLTVRRLSEEEIWERARLRAIGRFTRAMTQLVGRCRKAWLSPDELDQRMAAHHSLSPIEQGFVEIASQLYRGYLERLEAKGEEDFDGLMQQAVFKVESGSTEFVRRSGRGDLKLLRYVFVDEYQDFTESFHRLSQAIQDQNARALFFCVGDDWQAINRFAGADLHFYGQFEDHFPGASRLHLSTNYRSVTEVVRASNSVMKGRGRPAQAHRRDSGNVVLVDTESFAPSSLEMEQFGDKSLTPLLLRLARAPLEQGKEVLILSRRGTLFDPAGGVHSLDQYQTALRKRLPETCRDRLHVTTSHAAKGREANVVVVLEATERTYPLIHPNWIFARVLGEAPERIVEDDRRLFYVAMTRARDQLFLLTAAKRESPFLEVLTQDYLLDEVRWEDYPPPTNATAMVVVKVIGGYQIRVRLQADGFHFRGKTRPKTWDKSFPRQGFSVVQLQRTPWGSGEASDSTPFEVLVFDEQNQELACYDVRGGVWTGRFDRIG